MKSKTQLLAFALLVAAQAFGDSSAIAQGTKLTIGIGGINPGTRPDSKQIISENLGNLAERVRRKVVCENAGRLYGFLS